MESTPGRAGRRYLVGILALAILLSFAFGPFQTGRVAAQLPSAALPQIAITAQEYSFDAPAQITAGLLAVTYDNLGSQIHNLFFLRLKPGSTIDDIRAVRDLQQLMALAD